MKNRSTPSQRVRLPQPGRMASKTMPSEARVAIRNRGEAAQTHKTAIARNPSVPRSVAVKSELSFHLSDSQEGRISHSERTWGPRKHIHRCIRVSFRGCREAEKPTAPAYSEEEVERSSPRAFRCLIELICHVGFSETLFPRVSAGSARTYDESNDVMQR